MSNFLPACAGGFRSSLAFLARSSRTLDFDRRLPPLWTKRRPCGFTATGPAGQPWYVPFPPPFTVPDSAENNVCLDKTAVSPTLLLRCLPAPQIPARLPSHPKRCVFTIVLRDKPLHRLRRRRQLSPQWSQSLSQRNGSRTSVPTRSSVFLDKGTASPTLWIQ